MAYVAPKVKLLMDGWGIHLEYNLTKGTRTYIDSSAVGTGDEVDLPDVGSKWDDDWTNLTLKSIDIKYLENRPSCPKKYICYYDSTVINLMELFGKPPIPVQVELSGNFDVYDNPQSGTANAYTWQADSSYAANVRIPKLVLTETIILTRYIYGNDLTDFHSKALFVCLGKLNKTLFLGKSSSGDADSFVPPATSGFQPGTVLFTGATMNEMTSNTNQRKWEAKLHFQVKSVPTNATTPSTDPTASGAFGWNYVYNINTGKYDLLYGGGVTPLYDIADFDLLFKTSVPLTSTTRPDYPIF